MPKPAKFDSMTGSDDTPSEESTALVAAGEQAVASDVDLTSRQYTSQPDFSREDTMIPRLRLAQQLTPEVVNGDAESGQWVLIGSEPADKVVVVPLSWGKSRELRDDENEVICQSSDSRVGRGEYGVGSRLHASGDCADCPMSQWTENKKTGKNNRPRCSLIYSYVCWDETHQSLVAIDFKSTGTQAAKLLNTMVQAKGGFGKVAVQLGSQQQKTPRGVFHVPTVAIAKVEPDVLEMAASLLAK